MAGFTATGTIDRTVWSRFSLTGAGLTAGWSPDLSPADEDYRGRFEFTGTLHRVEIDAVNGKVFRSQAEQDQSADDKQEILETLDLSARMDKVARFLAQRIEVLRLSQEIGRQTKATFDERQREAIRPGEVGNALVAHQDIPIDFDAWDIDDYIEDVSWPIDTLVSAQVVETGPYRAAIRFEWTYESSRIVQVVSLADNAAQLEFDTYIDWHEHQTLLKAGFREDDLDGSWTPFRPVGCDRCGGSGYKGRVGIYQVMPISEEIQKIILTNGNALQIAEQARAEGVNDLRRSGLLKVMQGHTSIEEVLGVTNE